ncbi:MAG TPA: helix-turn-helix domain-containing protein [Spirochaetia bacterium]|nr:helix-turn-helix domain-containing protein [Spirochaetia bacterium]
MKITNREVPAAGSAGGTESNRDAIFRTALRLFSGHGYENVSMRQIASAVGIKASSIYNHFSSKAELLDEVVRVFRAALAARAMNEGFDDVDAQLAGRGPRALLIEIMLAPLRLLDDPDLTDIVRVVTRGQYHHEGIRVFLLEEMFRKPQALLVRVLAALVTRGILADYPAPFLAAELQAVLTANFYQRSLEPDRREVDNAGTRLAMQKHVEFFWRAAAKSGDSHKPEEANENWKS